MIIILKKKYILILLIIIHNCIYSQPSITWTKLYSGPYGSDAKTITFADNGYFYVLGSTNLFSIGSVGNIIKINNNGDSIWTKTIPEIKVIRTAAFLNNGDCVLTGDNDTSYSIKIDRNGNIIWWKNYGQLNVKLYSIKNTSDGGFIACGIRNDSSDGYVIKINSSGNKIWEKIFTTTYYKSLESIQEAYDGGYIATGRVLDILGDTVKIILLKIDGNGNTQWEKRFKIFNRSATAGTVEKFNQNYLIFGNAIDTLSPTNLNSRECFLKVDVNGNALDSRLIPYYKNATFMNAKIFNNNKFIFTSFCSSSASNDTAFAKITIVDTLGNIINQKQYWSASYIIFHDIFPLINNDIIFVGVFRNIGYENTLIMRTDNNLEGATIGIHKISELIPLEFKLYQNFPNPFNPQTKIKFDIKTSGNIKISLYDVTGKTLDEVINQKLSPGFYEIILNSEKYPSGVYFYSLTYENNLIQTRKMIILK